jgi:hypothetical protein
VRPEGLGKFKNQVIEYRTRDIPVYSKQENYNNALNENSDIGQVVQD